MAKITQKIKEYKSHKYKNKILSIRKRISKEPRDIELDARLAKTRNEIKAAQQLRFRVFYKELSANPNVLTRFTRRDRDTYAVSYTHLTLPTKA